MGGKQHAQDGFPQGRQAHGFLGAEPAGARHRRLDASGVIVARLRKKLF
jgi:hypothetical protein